MSQGSTIALMLFLFLGAVALVIFIYNKAEDDGKAHTPPPEPAPKPAQPKPVPVKTEEKRHVTIYEYRGSQPVARCAHCDGENPYGVKICRICGSEING